MLNFYLLLVDLIILLIYPNHSIDVVQSGGERIEPFLNLLEGRDGFKYKEMVDYSYYPQIKSKNENTTKQRI